MARYAVSFDLETHKIQPGLAAPPIVCGSVASLAGGRPVGKLLDLAGARAVFRKLIADDRLIICGANIAYDMLCIAVDAARNGEDLLPAIFAAYEAERVFDVQIAEQLNGLAHGLLGKHPVTQAPITDPDTGKQAGYSLRFVTEVRTGRTTAKVNDLYRTSYALLEHLPIAEYPPEAAQYPVDDAVNTLEDALIQAGHLAPPPGGLAGPCMNLHDLAAQTYSAWALHLGAAWGFIVDPVAVAALDKRTAEAKAAGLPEFIAAGIIRSNGTQDLGATKRKVAIAYGCTDPCPVCAGTSKVPSAKTGKQVQCKTCGATGFDLSTSPVPTTDGSRCDSCEACLTVVPKGHERPECVARLPGVSYGRDTLAESGDELLMNFAAFGEADKIQSTYLPWLRKGITDDGRTIPITLRPNVLLDTGRVSYGDVVQLLPRSGGVRECIVARPGYVFGSVDYEGGELVTHAQSCLWLVGPGTRANSRVMMAEALVSGVKVHDALGASMAGISYETMLARGKEFKPYRQAAKPANFGFPGGMGAVKLVLQQRKQGPDTPHASGPTLIKVDGKLVPGYKGLRFCILTGGASRCGEVKVTRWGKQGYERPCPPTCRACIVCAETIREKWFSQWPENHPYFKYVAEQVDNVGHVIQHLDNRQRGGAEFCAMANGYFQGMLATIAKRALRRASRECYVRGPGETALYGSRIIVFAHDEILPEHPESIAAEACERLAVIMVDEFRKACPDLAPACKAAPTLMYRWDKNAAEVRDSSGRLIPWEPS
jgi:hypothetical protein